MDYDIQPQMMIELCDPALFHIYVVPEVLQETSNGGQSVSLSPSLSSSSM